MSELYMYYTVLYQKISGLRHQYNTYSTNVTYQMRDPLHRSVSYWPKSNSDPALLQSRPQLILQQSTNNGLQLWCPKTHVLAFLPKAAQTTRPLSCGQNKAYQKDCQQHCGLNGNVDLVLQAATTMLHMLK
jgi:hypothetical protein